MASSVNGPASMYKLNSFYGSSSSQMDLPDCMYKMKSFHEPFACQSEGDNQGGQELVQLEQRQEAILAKLNVLKSKVDALAQKTSAGSKPAMIQQNQTTCSHTKGKALDGLSTVQDLVISANPSSPPLSVAVLYQLLAEQYKVITACHTHSSITGRVSEQLKQAINSNGFIQSRTGVQLALTLIWKDVSNGPSLMVSPNIQTAILGEGSIARYLARLLNPAYDSADIATATEIDQFVDLASQLNRGNNKEKAGVLRTLNSKLGKADYLVGQLSLADIVLWSAVHQAKQADSAPANVKKWLDRCAEHPAFGLAQKML